MRSEEIAGYEAYFALLKEWNAKINLVSRKSIDSSFAYHFADSVHLAHFAHSHLETREYKDLGSGAGFPGVIFAIRYPQVKVTLFEKLQKKRNFLKAVISGLGLKNVYLDGALPDKKYRDLFTARAVLPPPELFPFMKRHLLPTGRLVVSVGGSSDLAVPRGFRVLDAITYELPEDAGSRKALLVDCST